MPLMADVVVTVVTAIAFVREFSWPLQVHEPRVGALGARLHRRQGRESGRVHVRAAQPSSAPVDTLPKGTPSMRSRCTRLQRMKIL